MQSFILGEARKIKIENEGDEIESGRTTMRKSRTCGVVAESYL
jgi:hypothetical protein